MLIKVTHLHKHNQPSCKGCLCQVVGIQLFLLCQAIKRLRTVQQADWCVIGKGVL